ncbi:regulator of G-protein signaling 12 isoform X1 [Melanotaenia boesemani]|uniref:regulator of G-protein signaling 12 isoform X1 n=1 Tax=Melanotaenia boesemani TaxID=1250792 RepID=UPI001C04E672|nr:regulator of G-protein signaling 12 isoform X1 [Melanotaenia boesemani]XP_041842404.1 regulator of G-protein signaling 12 isoform X1 [Melanotaenia boesemani]
MSRPPTTKMRIQGQPEGARRRLDLSANGELRGVEVIRGRAGYGFTITGQRPCVLSGIMEGSPANLVGLRQGDRIMAINGADVSTASHETVVELIGSCKGPLRLVAHTEGRLMGNPILNDAKFGFAQKNGDFQKQGVFRTISDDSSKSSFNCSNDVTSKQRPVSEPDMSQWSQQWSVLAAQSKEETITVKDTDSVLTETDEVNPEWTVLNMTLVVGYLSTTELILNTSESEDECLKAILERIRQLGTEQDTHTLVMMKIMFDCIRLCDDAGAVLAAFPAENLVLGAVCAEDPRFFCLVTTAHIINGRVPEDGPLRASCHVFFIDPELGNHDDHIGIAGRFGFDCTPDSDGLGCLEFPQTPQDVLHFVTVLYSDMGEAVERLRVRLDAEAQQQAKENDSASKQGSASSHGDSGIGNASPPEERTDRDFPCEIQNHPGTHLPSCPWDYLTAKDFTPINQSKNGQILNPENSASTHSLLESLPGPDSLTSFYGGPPPRLEFQFKPPPPLLPLPKKTNFFGDPLRSSQRWFSRSKWPKVLSNESVPQETPTYNWSSDINLSTSTNNLPPPMSQIPSQKYQSAEGMMLPPREEWTKRFLEQRQKQRTDGSNKNISRFWGIGAIRASKRRSSKRLSLARSLDDLESAASSEDFSGIQLPGCCSQTSLNSNGSLPGQGSHQGGSEQRVASWSTCFERLLQDPVGVRYFSEFLKKEFSEENILFWQACEYFSHVPATDKKQLSQRAGEIYNSFLSSQATMPVNIDSQAQLADDVLTSPRPDMFKTQQLQIFNLMKFDSYSRFLKSSLYQECLRAEVDGQPLPDPYQIPCSPAPSKHSASSDRSTISTPKKEVRKQKSGRSLNEDTRDESADKKRGIFFSWSRNRSFGKGPKKKDIGDINLDYWGSNGRRESQGSLSSSASLEIPTSGSAGKIESENRHSVGVWDRSPKQCSVLLPDGSCSSITLRPSASIREVLQDLCRNINVNIAAVDLFLVGGEKPLVLDQDCMTLNSRDLRLERRTLFRLDLVPINRSVGLKAKPTKPVTEVLRPVVAKYGLHLSDLVAKISGDTEPLDLGAPISSLDGLRVVLEQADPCSGKDKSKSSSLKSHPPTRSLSAAGDERSTTKDFSVRASGPDSAFPGEKRKQKKINIDEAEEFFELLSRAQSTRANDQRGLLNKEDLVLPDFLRLAPPTSSCSVSSNLASSTPTSLKQSRENGISSRGCLTSSLRSESLDSSLSTSANGHSAARRCLLPPPRHPTFGTHLSPIPRPSDTRPSLRTVEEDTHNDLTLVGEGDISSPNSTLLPPSPSPMPSFESSLPEPNFTPPPPCSQSPDAGGDGKSSSEGQTETALSTKPPADRADAVQTVQEVMDVEGVHLEEGTLETSQGEDSELSLSFQGYVAELRQCQSKMRNAQMPQNGRNLPESKDCQTDLYKATIV